LASFERGAQRDRLLVDRLLGRTFTASHLDELIDMARVQLGEGV
jgi:hypothetical protein